MTVEELTAGIQAADASVRYAAWTAAPLAGVAAVAPLAKLAHHQDYEIARAATRGLWAIVRDAGRPGATMRREAVCSGLVAALESAQPGADQHRRDLLDMLSELADESHVPAIAALLADEALREDARLALERIPGPASLAALEAALPGAGETFKRALAQGLRARGVDTPGIPNDKMTPKYPAPQEA